MIERLSVKILQKTRAYEANVKALLSGVALAAMQLNKDNQMPCCSFS
jgi:hypothetical protein